MSTPSSIRLALSSIDRLAAISEVSCEAVEDRRAVFETEKQHCATDHDYDEKHERGNVLSVALRLIAVGHLSNLIRSLSAQKSDRRPTEFGDPMNSTQESLRG